MDYIEFDTSLEKGGIIHIPQEYRREVESAQMLHVKLELVRPKTQKRNDTLQNLIDNPFHTPGFKMPTRDEMHER